MGFPQKSLVMAFAESMLQQEKSTAKVTLQPKLDNFPPRADFLGLFDSKFNF